MIAWVRGILVLALAIQVVGVASGSEGEAQVRQSVAGVEKTDEAVLKERVLARWQALIQRDFDAAYQFETPAYRAIFTPRQFRLQYGGQIDWRMANVKDIHYDDPIVAKVKVEIAYRYAEPERSDQVWDMTRELGEIWLRKDGQWWHQRD